MVEKKFVCPECKKEYKTERALAIHIGRSHKKEEIEPKKVEVTEEVEEILEWKPKTKLGKDVFTGKVKDIETILKSGKKIMEPEIADHLVPNLESEVVFIGGRPGKGGGIQRTPIRITTKMHRSGRRYTTSAFAIVGNKDGIVGIGKGKGKESRESIEKAINKAKLNLIIVPRGCGSWECGCNEPHSIPYTTVGKSGSVRVVLMPAPKGVGLVTDDETKKILRLAGIKDVWIKTFGDTGTRINLITAVFSALKNLHAYKKPGG